MPSPTLLASIREGPLQRRTAPNTMAASAVRVLIRVTGAIAPLPATTRLTITAGSGEPVSKIALDWADIRSDEAGLRAILEALKIVKRYRPRRVLIYIDDRTAASMASGNENPPAALVGLALQVRAWSHAYRSVEIRYGTSSVAPTLPKLNRFAPVSGEDDELSQPPTMGIPAI